MTDFKKKMTVLATKEKAFEAVTIGINKWWGNVDNSLITKVDDEFSVFFEEETEWRFKVTVLNKFDEVHWKCVHANHRSSGLNGIKDEWLNSEIIFSFKELDEDRIEFFFEHKGLTPELNCYKICDAGWTHFIVQSLKQYLETGKGIPNLVE